MKNGYRLINKMSRTLPAALAPLLLLWGCAVGPNYQRPAIAAPPPFRGATDAPAATSLGDTKWFDLFKDDKLTGLVKIALEQNYDLRIASARVPEARAQLGITRSQIFPTLDANASFNAIRPSVCRLDHLHPQRDGSLRQLSPGRLHAELGA